MVHQTLRLSSVPPAVASSAYQTCLVIVLAISHQGNSCNSIPHGHGKMVSLGCSFLRENSVPIYEERGIFSVCVCKNSGK